MIKKLIPILLIGLPILFSCKHDPPVDPPPPVMNVITPLPDTVMQYQNGDTIHMVADLSDADALHEAFVYVRDSVDTFFTYEPYVHDLQSFHIDTFWVVSGMSLPSPGFVTFIAENHHEKVTQINRPMYLLP